MAKQKISVTIEEGLVAKIDGLAKRAGESRSETVERLCKSSAEQEADAAGKVEYFRLYGPHNQILKAFAAMVDGKTDAVIWDWSYDGPVELVLRRQKNKYGW